jgi:hypothetical protein
VRAATSLLRSGNVRHIIAAAIAITLGACDAHTRVHGRIVGPDERVPPTASLVFHGWIDHEVPIAPDGTFEASALHGGKAWLRVSADSVKTGIAKVGTGTYDCVLRLLTTNASVEEPWELGCVKRKAQQ